MPDSNPFYELLGGYYPGEPIPRKKPFGRYPEPAEFNTDALIENYLRAVRKELDKLSISEQLKNYFIDDVQRALIAQTRPSDVKYDPMRALELGDEEDVAGVQIKFDVNPISWIRDPEGMAKKTVRDWFDDFVEWSDFDAYTERVHLWHPLLRGDEDLHPFIEDTFQVHIEEGVETDFKPFQLMKLEIKTTKIGRLTKTKEAELDKAEREFVETQEDLFESTANSFMKFNQLARSYGSRNGAFRRFSNQAVQAIASELTQKKIEGVFTDPQELRDVNSFLHRARILRVANAINGKRDDDNFKFGEGAAAITESGIGAGLESISEDLGKYYMDKVSTKPGETPLAKTQENLQKVVIDSRKKADLILKEADDHFRSLGPGAFSEFETDTQPLRNLLKELEKLEDRKITDKLDARVLKGQIDLMREKFAMEGVFKGSLDRMSRKTIESHVLRGPIREIIFRKGEIVGSKNVLNVMDEALRFYKREDFYDLVDQLERNGAIGISADLMWNLIRKRLNGFTPASIVKEHIERAHYFGLVYDPNYASDSGIAGSYLRKGNRLTNYLMNESPLKGLFVNRQAITYTDRGQDKTLRFVGHKSLELGTDLWDRTQSSASPMYLNDFDFIKLLNGQLDREGRLKYNWYSESKLGFGGGISDLLARSKDLREWLKNHNAVIGLEFDGDLIKHTPENIETLKILFDKLWQRQNSPNFISIFQDKAGLLQKLSQGLNFIQDKVFKKFSKYLAPFTYIRNIIGRRGAQIVANKLKNSAAFKLASKALSKVLGGALAATTAGLSTFVWPVIEKALQYVINKTVDFVGAVLKSIKEAKVDAIEEFFEKGAEATFKIGGVVVGCFSIFIGIPVMLLVIFLLSAITPVDPTRMAGGQDFGGLRTASGPPIVCPPGVCEVISTVGCFKFLDNWTGGEGPEALPIIEAAAAHLESIHGRYVDRLCVKGDIEIAWNPGNGCGWARGLNRIEFSDGQCWKYDTSIPGRQELFTYLFAHETGHLYAWRYGMGALGTAQTNDNKSTLPTYVGPSGNECSTKNNNDEDFAETVGQYVVLSGQCTDVDPATFWNNYTYYCPTCFQGHYDFATSSYLFGP